MTIPIELDVLNQAQYLFLRNISEPRDNSLRLIVEEAISNKAVTDRAVIPEQLPELAFLRKNAWPIESVEGCRAFELYWSRYAAYLVTEELLGGGGQYGDEVFTGNLLRLYSRSQFLEHVARDTGGHTHPLIHYKLLCVNHLIDVVSYVPPQFREVLMDKEPE